jgi:hypothetical protein
MSPPTIGTFILKTDAHHPRMTVDDDLRTLETGRRSMFASTPWTDWLAKSQSLSRRRKSCFKWCGSSWSASYVARARGGGILFLSLFIATMAYTPYYCRIIEGLPLYS